MDLGVTSVVAGISVWVRGLLVVICGADGIQGDVGTCGFLKWLKNIKPLDKVGGSVELNQDFILSIDCRNPDDNMLANGKSSSLKPNMSR